MQKIAIFGKPGSGKSTLSKALASAIGIELYQLDSLVYKPNGDLVDKNEFDAKHNEIIKTESWVIDGLGPLGAFNNRLEAADTLVYIDLPYVISY